MKTCKELLEAIEKNPDSLFARAYRLGVDKGKTRIEAEIVTQAELAL